MSTASPSRPLIPLTLTAVGVVYGDIGTSPLYAMRECFFGSHSVPPTQANVLGVLSLIIYSLLLVISIKYIAIVMRADNQGEGGILALTALIPSEEAAPAITNATVLPLYFISGIFIPESEIPDGVLHFADAFPVRHFFEAFFEAWDPNTTGAGFALGHLGIVLAWGAAALVVALLAFRWEPRR